MSKFDFSHVEGQRPPFNTFDLSHEKKGTMKIGRNVPFFCAEVLPGDQFRGATEHLIRFMPLVRPVMHRYEVRYDFFFVPNRLSWDGWEEFITCPPGSTPPVRPYVELTDIQRGTIPDYLGIPTDVPNKLTVDALPFAAIGRCWNDFFRDQNLSPELTSVDLVDGDNTATLVPEGLTSEPWEANWEHDYFTSCLPFPQKGPAISIPIGSTAPILFEKANGHTKIGGQTNPPSTAVSQNVKITSPTLGLSQLQDSSGNELYVDNHEQLMADLTNASAAKITALRRAFIAQTYAEKIARYGGRMTEWLSTFFGVHAEDGRLQRPELIGSGRDTISVSEVLQTSQSDLTPLGDLAGKALAAGKNAGLSYHAKEHGYIIGFMRVVPRTAYSQGVPKMFLRTDPFDYALPDFAHIGEQEVKNIEIYAQGTADDNGVFGYQERNAEYKYMSSTVHGEMRPTGNMSDWQNGRVFQNLPVLDQGFIQCTPELNVFVDTSPSVPQLQYYVYNSLYVERALPTFSHPQL